MHMRIEHSIQTKEPTRNATYNFIENIRLSYTLGHRL